jgi:hypothetical protein
VIDADQHFATLTYDVPTRHTWLMSEGGPAAGGSLWWGISGDPTDHLSHPGVLRTYWWRVKPAQPTGDRSLVAPLPAASLRRLGWSFDLEWWRSGEFALDAFTESPQPPPALTAAANQLAHSSSSK